MGTSLTPSSGMNGKQNRGGNMRVYVSIAGRLGKIDYQLIDQIAGLDLIPSFSEYCEKYDESDVVVRAESIELVRSTLTELGAKIVEIREY